MLPSSDAPVRVRLRYPDLGTFCEKFAPNVTRGGVFLASREPRPVGSVLRFEVCLQDGSAVLTGEGRVTWVKEFNPAEPGKPHGMGVQFTAIDPACRAVLDRLLRVKELASRGNTGTIPAAGSTATASTLPAASGVGASVRPEERATAAVVPTEFDNVEPSTLRRIVERARVLGGGTDDIEGLLEKDVDRSASLAEALSEMPRYLANARRNTGLFRTIPESGSGSGSGSGDGGK